ncbi:hypothetical protein CNY67_13710 [Desulfovibrio sp. G11]|nr:hypothetical protein CNY67_13710 [Desulfovibrio sp. G11]
MVFHEKKFDRQNQTSTGQAAATRKSKTYAKTPCSGSSFYFSILKKIYFDFPRSSASGGCTTASF